LFLLDSFIHNSLVKLEKDIRFAVPVRNQGEGNIRIGEKTSLGYIPTIKFGKGDILLQAREKNTLVSIGRRCSFSNNVSIISRSSITIGDDCLIGDRVTIVDSDFHEISPELRHNGSGLTKPVVIEDNVWIGSDVTILKGVKIGKDSVIGAGSLVTKDIQTRVIAFGIPAKIIRSI
jgi:acetyltransferase-like isoleucine patch superfamily enzyme